MLSARNADHDLIEVPPVPRCRQTPPDLIGITLPELQRPLPRSFVADLDASGGEHLLDHAQAQGKPEIEPDCVANHFSRKAMAGIERITGRFHAHTYASIPSLLR
jgi:hypothetical protein